MAGISLRDYQLDAVKRMKTVAFYVAASGAVNRELVWHTIIFVKAAKLVRTNTLQWTTLV